MISQVRDGMGFRINNEKITSNYEAISDEIPFLWDFHSVALWLEITPQMLGYMIHLRKQPEVKAYIESIKNGKTPYKSDSIQKKLPYQYFTVPKKSGGYRLIASPKPFVKKIQLKIKQEILDKLPINTHVAVAYIPKEKKPENRKWQQEISEAVSNKFLVGGADIKSFFNHINIHLVRKYLKRYTNYNDEVIWTLTHCLTDMGFTPQGAITSPSFSNILMYESDNELQEAFAEKGWVIKRYSDNYYFGKDMDPFLMEDSDFSLEEEKEWPLNKIAETIGKMGFKLNNKSWCTTHDQMKPIMGMCMKEKPNILRSDYQWLRAAVHNFIDCKKMPSLFKGEEEKYLRALKGKCNYYNSISNNYSHVLADRMKEIGMEFIHENEFEYDASFNKRWAPFKKKMEKIDAKFGAV